MHVGRSDHSGTAGGPRSPRRAGSFLRPPAVTRPELPTAYWTDYETDIESMSRFLEVVGSLAATWPERQFVWRGVSDARWELYSSLYLAVYRTTGRRPLEGTPRTTGETLRSYESQIFREAREWGLQRTATDRLSALELLAALQHQGVPTRLIDFTHNATIGLWFAVEERVDRRGTAITDIDGRIFVAEYRAIPEAWATSLNLPWVDEAPEDWSRNIYVWTPPPIDPRMTRQQGCFVLGGVPSTPGGWNLRAGAPSRRMQADEIRACVSAPIRMNNQIHLERRRLAARRLRIHLRSLSGSRRPLTAPAP